ncbi:hypothetical protein L3Q82_013943 [Scortum barcoo]|uniref:Uncharacterized protein n=1 Tax=Scortum barcoo TaxID=214431 RepID=A0ACB8VYC9_9TELE|nr:hypothetical protein L3Q82_013943 [Scortum barcoo]
MAAAAPNPEDTAKSSSGGGGGTGTGTPSALSGDGDAEEAEDFTSSSHCSELSRRQNEQRKQGLFCDVTLAFSSGAAAGSVQTCEFSAHRSVLAAATDYFTPLLGGQFSESLSGRVEMKEWSSELGPDPDTVESVIQYMYTGEIRVSTCNVHEVLELADRFLLLQLKDFCGEFLKKKLSLTNCVAVHSLAHMYTLDQLALRAADGHDPPQLPQEITVDSEEVLFEAVVKWVQKNPEERSRYFEELFRLLRLPQIKPTYLTRVVKNERLVAANEACLRLVSEAVEGHAIRFENLKSADMEFWSSHMASFQPRFGQNMDVIMVVGGVSEGGDYLSECVGYFIYEDRWVNLPHIHNHPPGRPRHRCHRVPRSSTLPVQWNQALLRRWNDTIPIVTPGSSERGGPLRVCVTARTPVDTDNEDGLKTVTTRYDTESRQWQDVDSLPLIDNYCIFQMAVASTNFYHTASCCPKSYTVTSIEGAAICHFDEDVFIIGGWKNSDDVDKQYRKEAYRYCAERKRWMLLPPMPQPRCRATACHVRIPYRFLYGCQRYPMPQNLARQRDRMQQMQQLHRRTLTLRRQLQSQIEC